MCIINAKDLDSIPSKTMLYLTSTGPASKCLEGSYTYWVGEDTEKMIDDFRRMDIAEFPLVLYDSEGLKLASKAYWIFEAMDYSVLVLFQESTRTDTEFTHSPKGTLKYSEILMDIDMSRLESGTQTKNVEVSVKLGLHQAIDGVVDVDKVKKYLMDNGDFEGLEGTMLTGPHACLIALLLKFVGCLNIAVSVFDDQTKVQRGAGKSEAFYSLTESIYYDAEEKEPSNEYVTAKNSQSLEDQTTDTNLTHYDAHLMIAKISVSNHKNEENEDCQCRCLIL